MAADAWVLLTTAPNMPTAKALAGALIAEGVACNVVADTILLGEGQPCRIFVDPKQLRRAKWLLLQGEFTEEELAFLAVGNLPVSERQE
jgi:hypothetical protein